MPATAFQETLETIRAEEASVRNLFAGDGARVRDRRSDPRYLTALAEAAEFMDDIFEGRRQLWQLEEALSTSDFPLLFGDILDRQMLGRWREYPNTIEQIVRSSTVRDFRLVSRFAIDGAEGQLEEVPELAPYPGAELSEARDQFRVKKYGRRIELSWETIVNDDLDGLRNLPDRLALGARRSEQRFITELYVDSTGPHASLYDAAFSNVITGNPALTLAALQTGLTVLAAQTDTDGEPIFFEVVYLVVPPALEAVANNIINALQIEMTEAGGTAGQKLIARNWMANRVKVIVDPYIPIVASSANGNTMWALFGRPSDGRPALEFARLRGHAEPALFRKRPDAERVGGGAAGPDADMADFATDSHQYKVRHVFGGARLTTTGGTKATVASEGDGT